MACLIPALSCPAALLPCCPAALLPAACCLLPAACCLLPAACCLLPAACCLLPAAHNKISRHPKLVKKSDKPGKASRPASRTLTQFTGAGSPLPQNDLHGFPGYPEAGLFIQHLQENLYEYLGSFGR